MDSLTPPMTVVQPTIYINGFPGVGKLTVAKELQTLLPNAEVVDNHRLIDPVAAIYERSHPRYQALRKQVASLSPLCCFGR